MNHWILHKFPADLQRYAECKHCGFIYAAGHFKGLECIDIILYPYCPMCGNKMDKNTYFEENHDDGYVWEYANGRNEEDGYNTNV